MNDEMKPVKSVKDRYTKYTSVKPSGQPFSIGMKGSSGMESGYIYAPYIPIYNPCNEIPLPFEEENKKKKFEDFYDDNTGD